MKSLLALSVLFLTACGDAPVTEGEAPVSAEQLFVSQQCVICHGSEGHGKDGFGPDLRNIDEYWTPDSMAEYFANPKAYADKDARLKENRAQYRMQMPNNPLPEKRLRALAEYVLSLE